MSALLALGASAIDAQATQDPMERATACIAPPRSQDIHNRRATVAKPRSLAFYDFTRSHSMRPRATRASRSL